MAERLARCPICGKPADPRHRPFCSRRCADIDLGRWLGEAYRVPVDPASEAPDGKDEELG
ncbi:MAG TPA: DNA gyrase inhibitor YacG [Acetobacteraceae bacterium]|nr:DNA gyrase inhibitor YacG [Acetobacteraceae bacterium]